MLESNNNNNNKMNYASRKYYVTLVFTILFSLSYQYIYSQTKKQQQSFVTPSMARKISYSCQTNERMWVIFSNTNKIVSNSEADKILQTLNNHLDYAENYLMSIYYNYGTEMAYFALKKMGFTLQETEKVETEWYKERAILEAKQKIIEEQELKNKKLILVKRIEDDDIFDENMLSVKPYIKFDITTMPISPLTNSKDKYLNYTYDCVINKEGKLSLVNLSDLSEYSYAERFIYDYITNLKVGNYKAGSIELGNKNILVSSYVTIEFTEQRYKHRGHLDISIKKNKKTNKWEIIPKNSTDLMNWTCNNPKALKIDLENAINEWSLSKDRKGKIQLKINVYKRILSSNISDGEIELSHSFEFEQIINPIKALFSPPDEITKY